MNEQKIIGSKPFSVSSHDGVATVRDAIILLLSIFISYIGDLYFDGFDPQIQSALVVITYAGLKFFWKFINNTERMSML